MSLHDACFISARHCDWRPCWFSLSVGSNANVRHGASCVMSILGDNRPRPSKCWMEQPMKRPETGSPKSTDETSQRLSRARKTLQTALTKPAAPSQRQRQRNLLRVLDAIAEDDVRQTPRTSSKADGQILRPGRSLGPRDDGCAYRRKAVGGPTRSAAPGLSQEMRDLRLLQSATFQSRGRRNAGLGPSATWGASFLHVIGVKAQRCQARAAVVRYIGGEMPKPTWALALFGRASPER